MPIPERQSSAEAQHFPAPVRSFAAGRPPMVDLYQSTEGRFALCCEAESALTDTARWRLIDEGVHQLFVCFRDGQLQAGKLDLADVMSSSDGQVSAQLKARLAYFSLVASAANAIAAAGRAPSLATARHTADTLVAYLGRNPRALIPVIRLMRHDSHLTTHAGNVCVYAVGLGYALGIGRDALRNLALGALLHDLGMARVPPGIVEKAGPLTPEEWEIMQQHPSWSVELLGEEARGQETVRTIVYQHHERLDGSGYPLRIGKAEIHLLARIVGLVDKYDALTSDRPYRPRMQPFGALREIQEDMAGQFDRDLFVPLLTMLGPGRS